jgi:N4-gp56 family major capsid protein
MLYSDISPAVTAYADRRLLTRATPNNILGQFGQTRELPSKSTQTIIFRRYNKLAVATTPLSEGITPSGKTLTKTDIQATVRQYGDWVRITDVIQDTHTDPVLNETIDILGEQAPETYDVLRAGVLKAGSNVLYTNGTARASVNTVVDRDIFRTAVRTLKRQEAKAITKKITAGPNVGTQPVAACYVAVCHADLQPDLERCDDWVPVVKYASMGNLFEGEIGAIGEIRFVIDNNVTAWADSGGAAATNSTLSTTGTSSDVYPILIFGRDAYAIIPLAGKNAVSTYVNNPKAITGDELAQRGSVGWKGWTATVILNDLFMLRIETAAKG